MESKRDAHRWPQYAQLVIRKLEHGYTVTHMNYYRCRKALNKIRRERRLGQQEVQKYLWNHRSYCTLNTQMCAAVNPRLELWFGCWRVIYAAIRGYADEHCWLKFRVREKCRRAAQYHSRHQQKAAFRIW